MSATEPIENRLEKLGRAIGSDKNLVQKVMSRIDSIEIDRKKPEKSVSFNTSVFIKYFVKLTAAAVIIFGIAFGLKVLTNEFARPAYALEQTIDACKQKQQAHFTFVQNDILNKAAWVEYDTDGNIARVRIYLDINCNGVPKQVIAWQGGHTQSWHPKLKELRLFDDEDYTARILHFVHRYDPKQAVEYMQKMEQKGDVKIDIEQPADSSNPIVVTVSYEPNTFLIDSNFPPMREIMLVDQATKLVKAIEVWGPGKDFGHKENEWILLGTYKYDGYDKPFDGNIFDLTDEVGEDVNIIDVMTLDVGLEFTEPNLTEEQMAKAAVRVFFESLIAKDYNEAMRIWNDPDENIPKVREGLEKLKKINLDVVEIISIGKPYIPPHGWGQMVVPSTVAVKVDGQRIEKKLEDVHVKRIMGRPDRRIVEFDLNTLVKQ
jgi:hypothetical protein